MSVLKTFLQSLYNSMNGICDKTFLQTRPESVEDPMKSFVVVSLPASIKDIAMGGGYGSTTYCRVYIYVRNKSNGVDILNIDKITDNVMSKFPISDGKIKASNPKILLSGNDGNGFSVVTIQAFLTDLI